MQGFFIALEYLGADSNCHAHSGATPSRWCVYQFRHLGIYTAKIELFSILTTIVICIIS